VFEVERDFQHVPPHGFSFPLELTMLTNIVDRKMDWAKMRRVLRSLKPFAYPRMPPLAPSFAMAAVYWPPP